MTECTFVALLSWSTIDRVFRNDLMSVLGTNDQTGIAKCLLVLEIFLDISKIDCSTRFKLSSKSFIIYLVWDLIFFLASFFRSFQWSFIVACLDTENLQTLRLTRQVSWKHWNALCFNRGITRTEFSHDSPQSYGSTSLCWSQIKGSILRMVVA
jgi:hypothetical protein